MRKRRSFSLSQIPPWFMLCCVLLQAACDTGSGDTQKDSSPPVGDVPNSLHATSPESLSSIGNLSDDTVISPEQPTLFLAAQTGALDFQWQALDGQIRARLYRHDPLLGGETLTHEFNDPTADNWQLPSQTQARPWHRQQYRIELCTPDECVSSARMPVSGLAPDTIDTLTPAVFVENERYADRIALNNAATLAVLTLPVEGALEFQARISGQWVLIQRLRLDALSISITRILEVALSDTGNTLAIFVRDSNDPTRRAIRILERLGEAWVQTATWPVSGAIAAARPVDADTQPVFETPYTKITLSSDGKQVLLHSGQSLTSYRQAESVWSEVPFSLNADDAQDPRIPGTPVQLITSAQNARFTRVFTIVRENQQLYLGVWTPSGDASSWQRRARFPVQNVNPNAPLSIISDTAGSSVVIAGWEDTCTPERAAVMWRYSVEPASPDTLADSFSLILRDSLRALPTEHANAVLLFAADASLALVALGWHAGGDPASTSTIQPQTALSTYVYDSQTRQWLSALELPQNLPALAEQSFATEVILSADGTTMMMSSIAGNTDSPETRVGEVLIMR